MGDLSPPPTPGPRPNAKRVGSYAWLAVACIGYIALFAAVASFLPDLFPDGVFITGFILCGVAALVFLLLPVRYYYYLPYRKALETLEHGEWARFEVTKGISPNAMRSPHMRTQEGRILAIMTDAIESSIVKHRLNFSLFVKLKGTIDWHGQCYKVKVLVPAHNASEKGDQMWVYWIPGQRVAVSQSSIGM